MAFPLSAASYFKGHYFIWDGRAWSTSDEEPPSLRAMITLVVNRLDEDRKSGQKYLYSTGFNVRTAYR